MLDKALNILTRVLAVFIVLVISVMISTLYNKKYMLVQGAEKTLDNSIYSSNDLEIAVTNIDLTNENMDLIVKNKGDKVISLVLKDIQINNSDYNINYKVDIKPQNTETQTINITKNDIQNIGKINKMEFKFTVNNRHDIDLEINIAEKGKDE